MAFEQPPNAGNASTSSLTLPKKGILKRSCSHSGIGNEVLDRRSRLLSLRLFRPSSDRYPEKKASRIPKLSLTWSEKNAVAIFGDTTSEETLDEPDDKPSTSNTSEPHDQKEQHSDFGPLRQTDILSDSDDVEEGNFVEDNLKAEDETNELLDVDCQSVTSTGSSHIAGKWWFGKSTRFVPHCERRGCHNQHYSVADYITPTQRYLAQIRSLKKQLKSVLDKLEEKEAHLNRLKVRLNELESLIDSSYAIREEQRRLKEEHERLSEEIDSEKEQQRIAPVSSAPRSPSQTVKLFLALEETKSRQKTSMEKETMTDFAAGQIEWSSFLPVLPSSSPSDAIKPITFSMQHELLLQLQAYQNEIVVWRTKAAHLQTLLKEKLLERNQPVMTSSAEGLPDEKKRRKGRRSVDDSDIDTYYTILPSGSLSVPSKSSNACTSLICSEVKEKLEQENQKLQKEVETKKSELDSLDGQLKTLRTEMLECQKDHSENIAVLQNMKKDFEQSAAEVQAANLTIIRLQNELSTKTQAMEYLEERSQAYRNIILDNDLTVPDESTENWRRGFADPRFAANPSKKTQTQLTSEDLQHNEAHLHDLKDRFKVLKEEHSTNESNWMGKVREFEENLSAKNYLVELLTVELEKKERSVLELLDKHEKEKQDLELKIGELSKIADRVPTLQIELDNLQQEKSLMHLQLQDAKDEFDAGLENSLTKTLKKYQQQSSYWTEKMNAANETNQNLRARILVLEREIDQMRLRMKVEKADMSQKLTSSIRKVDHLRSQINRSTRDVEVEAYPNYTSKYVTCKPNTRNKITEIKSGDLFDEMEERLKLCQGELIATRRQVEVLQQKLVDTVQTQVEDQKSSLQLQTMIRHTQNDKATEVNNNLESNEEIEELKEKIDQLEQQNFELTSALSKAEDEKWNLELKKRQHIAQLAAEFDSVRKELDQEISKYESERCRLKNRIKILTKAKLERDWLIQRLRKNEIKNLGKPSFAAITRCVSLPYLRKNSVADELQTARACNSILMQVNANLNKELMIIRRLVETSMQNNVFNMDDGTKPKTSEDSLSPGFRDLASDLNQVRKELENIILQIDKNTNSQDSIRLIDSDKRLTLSEEEKREVRMESDLDRLRKALKRSWADREILSKQLDRITAEFQELSVRPDNNKNFLQRSYVYDERAPVMRSRSFAGLAKWWSDQIQAESQLLNDQNSASPSNIYQESVFIREAEPYFTTSNKLSKSTSCDSVLDPVYGLKRSKVAELEGKSRSVMDLYETPEGQVIQTGTTSDKPKLNLISQRRETRTIPNPLEKRKSSFRNNDTPDDLENLKRVNETLKSENIRLNNLKNARINDLKAKITVLLEQNETLAKKLDEIEKERQEMYLTMFKKGRQAAKHDIDELNAYSELTEHHVVLRFLHDAFYYYLLNKGDAREHLQVIMAMLNFTEQQRDDVLRRRGVSH